ncbi:hypothetical protein [Spirosoma sp.]|uniref:hypothetical protein n=1 Tax=Spirosoma sp. TaxID=1899569 RepID=UPI00262243D0|nr:hypothetical protein [Spirosoma sp.]MCX6215549.1 hypothetical protein [Spirosoma sp.]
MIISSLFNIRSISSQASRGCSVSIRRAQKLPVSTSTNDTLTVSAVSIFDKSTG